MFWLPWHHGLVVITYYILVTMTYYDLTMPEAKMYCLIRNHLDIQIFSVFLNSSFVGVVMERKINEGVYMKLCVCIPFDELLLPER